MNMNELINKTKEYVKDIFKNEFSGHDYFHTLRVYNTAIKIAEMENADIMVVSLAALLHDVDDVKISPNTSKNKDNAVKFMKDNNISEDNICRVISIIDEISFIGTDSKKPSTIEGCCVQDADRLDAIGAIGIARTFSFGGNHNRVMHDPDILPKLDMNEEEYRNNNSTTLNHFYEKLFKLKDLMNTKSAKEIAINRDKFMHVYIDQFLCEWSGER